MNPEFMSKPTQEDAWETIRFAIFDMLIGTMPQGAHIYLEAAAKTATEALKAPEYAWVFKELSGANEVLGNPTMEHMPRRGRMTDKIVMEGQLIDVDTEDGGAAKIGHGFAETPDAENGFFVRLQSWDTNKEHTTFNKLFNRRLRVTVEIIE